MIAHGRSCQSFLAGQHFQHSPAVTGLPGCRQSHGPCTQGCLVMLPAQGPVGLGSRTLGEDSRYVDTALR